MRQGENNFIHVLAGELSEPSRADFLLARKLSACDLAGLMKRMNRSRERWPRRVRADAAPRFR